MRSCVRLCCGVLSLLFVVPFAPIAWSSTIVGWLRNTLLLSSEISMSIAIESFIWNDSRKYLANNKASGRNFAAAAAVTATNHTTTFCWHFCPHTLTFTCARTQNEQKKPQKIKACVLISQSHRISESNFRKQRFSAQSASLSLFAYAYDARCHAVACCESYILLSWQFILRCCVRFRKQNRK